MELRVMAYFLAVAREENITKAAALLHITQPTLSRQLAELEEEVGVKLFKRGSRKIVLTEAGQLLRRRATEMVELADKTKNELSCGTEVGGTIFFGLGEFKSVALLARILRGFSKAYPQVKYNLYSAGADMIRERMDNGLDDLGLLLEPVGMEKYNFIRMPIRERWALTMPAGDPLAAGEFVTAEDMRNLPLIITSRKSVQNELACWFGSYFENLDIRFTHNIGINSVIISRQGLGYLLAIEGARPFLDPRYVCSRPLQPPLESTTVLAWKRGQVYKPAVRHFLEYFRQYLAEHPEIEKQNF